MLWAVYKNAFILLYSHFIAKNIPYILNPYILSYTTFFRWASLVNIEKVSFYTGSGVVLGIVVGLLLAVICHFPTEFTALVTLGISVAGLIASLFA